MIDRSKARDNPKVPVALEVAAVMGTRAADTILASAHMRVRQQAGHMSASDLIKLSAGDLVRRGPSTYGTSMRCT